MTGVYEFNRNREIFKKNGQSRGKKLTEDKGKYE